MLNDARTPINVECPICHHPKAHVLYSVDSPTAARHFCAHDEQRFNHLKSIIESLWNSPKALFIQCQQCLFSYAYPFVEADKRFYEVAYLHPNYVPWKWEYQITYDEIKRIYYSAKQVNFTLLEIGAGDGAFIKKISPQFTAKDKILCVEYSSYGKQEIGHYGIPCISEDIRTLKSAAYHNFFDVICMFQVLEHMSDIDSLFRQLTLITKNRGLLFIAVPNYKQREFYDQQGIREDIPPIHIGRWNKNCFNIIAHRYGWSIERHEFEPQNGISRIERFLSYAYQRGDVLSKRLGTNQNKYIRGLLTRFGLLLYALHNPQAVMTLLRSKEYGVSQWICLKKL
jgi:SAM-dependent methyltransferase